MNQNFFNFYVEILLFFIIIALFRFNKSSTKINLFIWVILAITPILYYYFIVFSNTANIPFKDDYPLLESIYNLKISSTFSEWNQTFFKQVNQHRFGFERAVMWMIYKIMGHEDIKVQIIIGNLFLLGIIVLLYNIFKKLNLPFVYFIPLPFLLFNLTYFENAIWGIAAIQNTPIIFFALLTIHFLIPLPNKSLYLAIIFATITLFTSGNGISIWIVGIMILFFQKQWSKLIIWIFIMTGIFAFYFLYDYEMIAAERENLSNHPLFNIQYLMAFWGNIFFQNNTHPDYGHIYIDILLCIFTGIFLLILMLVLTWENVKIKVQPSSYNSLMLFGGMAFFALTGLMFVVSRPTEVKIFYGGEIFSRRYMIFGCAFLCLGYLSMLYLTKGKKILQILGFIGFIVVGMLINVNSYYTSLADVHKQHQELKLDGYYWKNHKMLLSFGEKYGEKFGYNHPTYMINLLSTLDSSGIHKLSQVESLRFANLIRRSNSKTSELVEGKLETMIKYANTISREKRARILFRITGENEGQNIKFIVLKSRQNIFIMPAIPTVNSLDNFFYTQTLFSKNVEYENWKAKFPSDWYEVWIIKEGINKSITPLFCRRIIKL